MVVLHQPASLGASRESCSASHSPGQPGAAPREQKPARNCPSNPSNTRRRLGRGGQTALQRALLLPCPLGGFAPGNPCGFASGSGCRLGSSLAGSRAAPAPGSPSARHRVNNRGRDLGLAAGSSPCPCPCPPCHPPPPPRRCCLRTESLLLLEILKAFGDGKLLQP